MKTIYVAEAINYARTAKTNIEYAITILESKVELTYEDGGTVLDEAYEAKSAINKILKFDIEDGNVNDLATLCINAGTKTIKVQKASVELIKAFAD